MTVVLNNIMLDEKKYKPQFSNLLIPSGFKMGKTHLAKYSIKLYKGEMICYLSEKGAKWLSIDFGEAPEVFIYLKT